MVRRQSGVQLNFGLSQFIHGLKQGQERGAHLLVIQLGVLPELPSIPLSNSFMFFLDIVKLLSQIEDRRVS